jgi:uncharacterized phage protein (TIGR01671 family)
MAVMLPVWNIDFACPAGKTSDEIEPNEITIMPDGTDGILVGVDTQAVLMQSTGLTDKNGKEIFEGDILRYYTGGKQGWEPNTTPIYELSAIAWEEGISGSGDYYDFVAVGFSFEYSVKECEVVGNVWQNPDLLPPSA